MSWQCRKVLASLKVSRFFNDCAHPHLTLVAGSDEPEWAEDAAHSTNTNVVDHPAPYVSLFTFIMHSHQHNFQSSASSSVQYTSSDQDHCRLGRLGTEPRSRHVDDTNHHQPTQVHSEDVARSDDNITLQCSHTCFPFDDDSEPRVTLRPHAQLLAPGYAVPRSRPPVLSVPGRREPGQPPSKCPPFPAAPTNIVSDLACNPSLPTTQRHTPKHVVLLPTAEGAQSGGCWHTAPRWKHTGIFDEWYVYVYFATENS